MGSLLSAPAREGPMRRPAMFAAACLPTVPFSSRAARQLSTSKQTRADRRPMPSRRTLPARTHCGGDVGESRPAEPSPFPVPAIGALRNNPTPIGGEKDSGKWNSREATDTTLRRWDKGFGPKKSRREIYFPSPRLFPVTTAMRSLPHTGAMAWRAVRPTNARALAVE